MKQSLEDYLEGTNSGLKAVLLSLAGACAQVSRALRIAPLEGAIPVGEKINVQGEAQKALDIIANDLFIAACERTGHVALAVSEEIDNPISFQGSGSLGVLFDPLDGSSNLDSNVTVGSIFSIIRAEDPAGLLVSGASILAAGYAAYGPSTTLVITLGETVDMFSLDDLGTFRLSRAGIQIPQEASEYAINSSRQHLWEPPVAAFIKDCLAGEQGVLGRKYSMRWTGSMVADVQRLLAKGGIFLYPADRETARAGGRLRLLYEGNPMAKIVEVAGGAATTGLQRILDLRPTDIHQRVPVILGSQREVERLQSHFSRTK